MNKIYLLLISIILLITSCANDKIKFTEKHIQKETENNQIVDISYIISEGNSLFTENFNKENTTSIIRFIDGEEDNENLPETVEEAVDLYLINQENLYQDISDTEQELMLSDSISYQNNKMVCLKSERYSFSGGIHGYSQVLYYNFDISQGETIPNEKLFSDEEAVTEFAEKYFREKQGIPTEQSYDEAGFWFENGYQLPKNIGFTEDDMILHYNPYEIAPYVFGEITVTIPISKVKQWLTFLE